MLRAWWRKGEEEIQGRKHGLDRSLRVVLILVDGKSTVEQLKKKGAGLPDVDSALEELIQDGFVVQRAQGAAETTVSYADIKVISRTLESSFLNGEIDEARIFYTSFVSTMVQKPLEQKILPISREGLLKEETEDKGEQKVDFLLEPSPEAILHGLLPHLSGLFF